MYSRYVHKNIFITYADKTVQMLFLTEKTFDCYLNDKFTKIIYYFNISYKNSTLFYKNKSGELLNSYFIPLVEYELIK